MNARSNFLIILLVTSFSAPAFSTWTEPIPLDELNTNYSDKAPFLSFDGLTLYFSRQDGPGWHYTRLYQATCLEPDGPFTSIEEISSMNSDFFHVDCAWVSPDNLRMYYYTAGSTRKIMLTEKESIYDVWLPGEGITELNAIGGVANPYLTPDELTIFFTGTNMSANLLALS